MSTNQHHQTSTPDADNCDPLRTKSGQGERLKVAAYTEPQIQAFCRSHMIPRQNVVRIRKVEDLYGHRTHRLLLLPSWWLGTDSEVISHAKHRGWEIADVTEEEVLNGPPAPLRGRPGVIDLLRKVTGDPMAEPTPPAERPTPITDAFRDQSFLDRVDELDRLYHHAEMLELQLAEAREQRDRLAESLRDLMAEYDDRKSQFGDSPLWAKHEEVEVIEECHAMLAEMRAVKETTNNH